MRLIINTDGGARGNPGPAGIGAVIADDQGRIISRHKRYIGTATNNSAEYQALILALREASQIPDSLSFAKAMAGGQSPLPNDQKHLEIRMDSELIVRQMQGRYKIKEPQLKLFAAEVLKLSRQFKSVSFRHVPREQNESADKLVNEAIDEAIGV